MNEKMVKRIRRIESRMDAAESTLENHDKRLDNAAKWAAAMQASIAEISEMEANRDSHHRVRHAERTAALWRRVAYIALVAAIIVEIIAILVIHANAACTAPVDPPVGVTASETAPAPMEEPEEAENELIEAALLARSHAIDECTITFYCSEKHPHICGTGDGIAADGTTVLAWATCSVDPDVIPLGSTVLVDLGDGYGLRTLVANDTGGAVKGNHIDLCVATHEEALQLGRRTATVYWVAVE